MFVLNVTYIASIEAVEPHVEPRLRSHRLDGVDRVLVAHDRMDAVRPDPLAVVEGDEELLSGLQPLQAVHPVRDDCRLVRPVTGRHPVVP